MINTSDPDERIRLLRSTLANVTGTGRIGPLIELGRAHSDRYGRDIQRGLPSAADDLVAAVAALREAHGLLSERDPWRPGIAAILARLMGIRYITNLGSAADRDGAIDLFTESLAHPDLSAADVEMGRYMCASLLLLRATPEHQELFKSGSLDIATVVGMVSAMAQGEVSARRRQDLDLAATLVQQMIDTPSVVPQLGQVAGALMTQITMLRTIWGLGGPGGSFDLAGMMQTVNQAMRAAPPGSPGHDEITAMRAGMFAQGFGGPGGSDSLGNAMRRLIEERSGVRMMLPALVQELARLTGEGGEPGAGDTSRMARLLELDTDGGLPDATALLLVDATLAALAYRPAAPADRVVELANAVVGESAEAPGIRGRHHLLAALALTMRGYWAGQPDDLRSAAGHLRESVMLLAPGHPLAPGALGLLGVLLDDRYVLGGPATDRVDARQLVELAGRILDAHRGTAGRDAERLAVVRGLHCLGQIARAVHAGDRSGLGTATAALRDALGAVPETYPWHGRLASGLALAHLVLGGTDDLARGADVLATAARAVPEYHTGRPGLTALAGLAALPAARAGASDAAARAVDLLRASLDAGGRIPIDRTVLLAALGAAHLVRACARDAGPAETGTGLDLAVRHLAQARDRSVARPTYLAHPVLRDLATAYRRRADAGAGGHEQAARTGLAALRSAGAAVPMESGVDRRLALARSAATFGLTVAHWCAADGWPDGAAEAAELSRVLTVLGATTVADVPDRLHDAGQPDLGREWRQTEVGPLVPATLRELFDLSPPTALYRRVREALGTPVLRTPTVAQTAAALRAVDADLLGYLLPAAPDRPGRLVWISAAGRVGMLAAPGLTAAPDGPVAHHLAGGDGDRHLAEVCDWAWPAAVGPLLDAMPQPAERDGPAKLVLVPHGTLGRVPWHAARTAGPTGEHRYASSVLTIAYAASAGQLVGAAGREPPPVTENPVFLVNPLGDDGATAYAVLALRRVLYPRSTGLGRTGDPQDRPGTADSVVETLSRGARTGTGVSMLQLHCRGVLTAPPAGPWWELAGPRPGEPTTTLPMGRLPRRPASEGTGGLVTLCLDSTDLLGAEYDIAFTPATALIAAGATGVAGSGWLGGPPGHRALPPMFHHFLTDRRMSPVDALHAAYRWLLDPDRKVPPQLASALPEPIEAVGIGDWARFRYQGR
ncbi:hypothetical protein [Plantactinospora soyae]|uniref:CHAT domain-containing protein n=1 Tax=Plantactinospora soyae TaxID=1544732 RepID=A0A927MF31_9ACTN|nr:hypothetical protein [Plantactinospora soyae]MBE1491931.1 hypothetical protein [Plantactinospora soyae]